MFKLKRRYHNEKIYHPIMGHVTLYKEADQQLLKLWYKFLPYAVEWKEIKTIEDDSNQEGEQ